MKIKTRYTRPVIPDGTTRLKRVFAWRPTYVAGYWVWLGFYDVLQGYIATEYVVTIDGRQQKIRASNWTDITKRI